MAKDFSKVMSSFQNDAHTEGVRIDSGVANRVVLGVGSDFLNVGTRFQILKGRTAIITGIDANSEAVETEIPMLLCISAEGAAFAASSNIFSGRGTDGATGTKYSPTSLAKRCGADEGTLVWRELCGCTLGEVAEYLTTNHADAWYEVLDAQSFVDSNNREKNVYCIAFAE